MQDTNEVFESPLNSRYASSAMKFNFSARRKVTLWRQLWIWLAEAQKELGVEITDEQLEEMRGKMNDIDFEKAALEEVQRRHDVMAHVYVFASACPKASPIIHLVHKDLVIPDLVNPNDVADITSQQVTLNISGSGGLDQLPYLMTKLEY
nr:unnamed protein product [Spirometra erinaceieuropaei]